MRSALGPVLLAMAAVVFTSQPAVVAAPPSHAAGAVPSPAAAAAPREQIPGDDWKEYNKTLDSQRFSPLKQIDTGNASTLKEVCRVQVAREGAFEAGPIVIDGTMYVTIGLQTLALDPATCAIRWRHTYDPQQQPAYVLTDRGVAYANGRLFRGTPDARVIALDAATGKVLWTDVVGDPRRGETVDGAPIAWNGLVLVGTNPSEMGIGRVMALDAVTGREVWQFDTIPTGRKIGAETWKNPASALHGGGGTWSSLTLDPTTAELFVPVGNPGPALSPQDRPGANLFTDCILVLDARTGALRWWYQTIPNDGLDRDLAAAPVLFQDGSGRYMVAAASKSGYLYVVDRKTRELKFKVSTTTVGDTRLGSGEVKACPGLAGGTQWNGPAYDPALQVLFVGAVDQCSIVHSVPGQKFVPGEILIGGTFHQVISPPASGWITAFDANTGRVRWKYHAQAEVIGALTATAGGIVMGGDNAGNFLVFDSASGKLLEKVATGGSISGGIVTYLIGGRQYVALDSGSESVGGFGTLGRPTVIVMEARETPQAQPSTPEARRAAAIEHGLTVYQHHCFACHHPDGAGIPGFPLKDIEARMSREQLINWILNPRPPMPRTFVEPVDTQDAQALQDLATYLEQWK